MAKQTKAEMRDLEDFKEELKAMLEHQNRRMEHLIWQVVGSENHQIEGLKPALKRLETNFNVSIKRLEKDVHELTSWKDGMWKVDVRKLFTWEVIKKGFLIIGTLGGGSFGLFELLKVIFK